MTKFYSYMVKAYVNIKREDNVNEERSLPVFHIRSDMRGGPQTAPEAATVALQILTPMWTEGSAVASIIVSVGSLDEPTDAYTLRKTFPSGRVAPHR